MNSADLDKLIEKVAQGDISALEGIYVETKESVYSYALCI